MTVRLCVCLFVCLSVSLRHRSPLDLFLCLFQGLLLYICDFHPVYNFLFSVCMCLYVSFAVCLYLSICLCLLVSVGLSLSVFVCLFSPLSLSLSLCLSQSLSLSLSFSRR